MTKKRFRILSLTDNTPYILAWGNDEGFDRVFVEQLKNLASPGDLLIAISGSGNSPNILKAVEWANRHDMTTSAAPASAAASCAPWRRRACTSHLTTWASSNRST